MRVAVTCATNPGAVRPANEDAIVIGPWVAAGPFDCPSTIVLQVRVPTVCAIADGMGGHAGGEKASDHVARGLAAAAPGLLDDEAVNRALRQLHLELFDLMDADSRLAGMGTTIAGLVLAPTGLLWFNVGDSRVYEEDQGYLGQISVDDTPPAPGGLQRSSMLTQSLGGTSHRTAIETHTGSLPLRFPSRFLLCSDGLTDVVPLDDIEKGMRADPRTAVEAMVKAALDAGAPDNISVAIVELLSEGAR